MKIQQHLAWKGKIEQAEIISFLAGQSAFTYVLTQVEHTAYLLSYIRGSDRKIIHVHFREVYDANLRFCGYRNGSNIIFSSVDALIQYKLKGRGSIPESVSLRLSA